MRPKAFGLFVASGPLKNVFIRVFIRLTGSSVGKLSVSTYVPLNVATHHLYIFSFLSRSGENK